MPLAALIAAQDQTDMGDGLRATLPVAGRTLIELQAMMARRAGAEHIVLLVERVPAALAQAVDRLQRQGARVEIARSVAEAANRLHPNEHVLLIADGCVVSQGAIDRLAASPPPALLILPDTQDNADFERIDSEARWAGVALMDGAALAATAQMLGDWDLSSTLLRRLVQRGAARIDALDTDGSTTPPLLVMGPVEIGVLEAQIMRDASPAPGNWVQHYLHRPIATLLLGPLVARRIDRLHVAMAAVAIAWLGAAFSPFGLFWPAIILMPLAAALAAAERRMSRIWSDEHRTALPLTAARHLATLCVLAMIARAIAADGEWGWWLVAALVPVSLTLFHALIPIARALEIDRESRWLASADALIWIAPALTVVGGWRWMVMVLAFYAFLSFLIRLAAVRTGAIAAEGAGV